MHRAVVFAICVALSQQCDVNIAYSTASAGQVVQACYPQKVCATVATGQSHNAQLVTQDQYDTCTAPAYTAPAQVYSGGSTIELSAPSPGQTHYHMCTLTGHCSAGAKFRVVCDAVSTTAAASSDATRGTPSATWAALGLGVAALLAV